VSNGFNEEVVRIALCFSVAMHLVLCVAVEWVCNLYAGFGKTKRMQWTGGAGALLVVARGRCVATLEACAR